MTDPGAANVRMGPSRIDANPSVSIAPLRPAASDEAAGAAPRDTFTFVYDAREAPPLANVRLKGSFDPSTGRYDPQWNGGQGLPMYDDGTHGDVRAGDAAYTAQVRLDTSDPHTFEWGVEGDVLGRDGRVEQSHRWLIMTEQPPRFTLDGGARVLENHPVPTRDLGVQRIGADGIRFKTWAPGLGTGDLADYALQVEICDSTGALVQTLPMVKDPRSGAWSVERPAGWSDLQGKPYRYAARDSQGRPLVRHFDDGTTREVLYADPASRYVQGPQRGLEAIHVDPVLGVETGWYDARDKGGPNYSVNPQWARFSVAGHPDAERIVLRLQDEQGRTLTKADLLARLGAPALVPYDQATPEQRENVDILRRWKTDVSSPVTQYAWIDRVGDDGSISLERVGDSDDCASWVVVMNSFPALQGLRYRFELHENGELVGDVNGDGTLQPAEAARTPFNDPWSNVVTAHPGTERLSIIRESRYVFRHDDMPRKETDPKRFVIYEAHVGSFMGSKDNAHASTFADVMRHLDYVEKLGANTIEILPVQEFGGKRDWGYTPDFLFAGTEAYGFELPRDEAVRLGVIGADELTDRESVWVNGTDAFKVFVDEAHRRGLNVMADVVYNHVAGRPDAQHPLELIDGDAASFYRWNGTTISHTPWGAKPNFGAQAVKDFYAANAAQQLTELHVDGLRFDFVQALHESGTVDEKREGMNALRQISRTIDFIRPNAYTVAEDFTANWLVTADLQQSEWQGEGDARIEKRGMGFDGVWDGGFHHDLLGAVAGSADMDTLADAITRPNGVRQWQQAVVYSHSHDEVGNSGSWVTRVAAGSVDEADIMAPWPRAAARTAAAITLTSAGVPMLWQGEEHLANNDFKHAMPSTWGVDRSWLEFPLTPDRLDLFARIEGLSADARACETARLSPQERELLERYEAMPADARQKAQSDAARNGHFRLYRDLIALRGSSSAFEAGSTVRTRYTHNADRVLAFERESAGERFVIVSSFSDARRDGYNVYLPPGRWNVVLNTDDRVYGGEGAGSHGEVAGGDLLDVPAGGTLILKRVG